MVKPKEALRRAVVVKIVKILREAPADKWAQINVAEGVDFKLVLDNSDEIRIRNRGWKVTITFYGNQTPCIDLTVRPFSGLRKEIKKCIGRIQNHSRQIRAKQKQEDVDKVAERIKTWQPLRKWQKE